MQQYQRLLVVLFLAIAYLPDADAIVLYDTSNMLGIMCKMQGSVLLTVWPQMAVTAGIAVFATMLRASMGEEEYLIQDVKGHATLGTALAFLNVFRSNLSYGRYWDGRGQLGVMVKSGRELVRKLVTYTRVPEDEQSDRDQHDVMRECVRLTNCLHKSIVLAIANFDVQLSAGDSEQYARDIEQGLMMPNAEIDPDGKWLLNENEKSALERAEKLGDGEPDSKGRPILIASMLSHKLYYMYEKGWINAAVLKKIDLDIDNYIGAWMACEKIVGVPMVFPYTQMLTLFLVLFVYTFPLPLAHIFFNEEAEFNGFIITPFVSMLVAFAFFGMNAVGIEIENPLGKDANDLPMAKMCIRVGKDTAALFELRGSESLAISDQMNDVIQSRKESANLVPQPAQAPTARPRRTMAR
jgi:putative membrane protein